MIYGCICTWAVYSLQVLQTTFWFITRVTLYDVIGIFMQFNIEIWRLWLCQASCILICDLFPVHQVTENTIVLKLITSNSDYEVTNSLYKPQKKKICTLTLVRVAILLDSKEFLNNFLSVMSVSVHMCLYIFWLLPWISLPFSNIILNLECSRKTEHV